MNTTIACAIPNLKILGSSDVQVQFNFASSEDADRTEWADYAHYKLGRNAFAGPDRAYLYFDCASSKFKGSARQNPVIVQAVLVNNVMLLGRYQPKGGPEKIDAANLSVLNSVALKVADKLQCQSNGGLTPNPTLHPAS